MQFGCEDICCGYGCPLDLSEVDRLTPYQHEIERRTNHDAAMWFQNEVEANSDYPSGYVKTPWYTTAAASFMTQLPVAVCSISWHWKKAWILISLNLWFASYSR